MSLRIEPARADDAAAIAQVHVASWRQAYDGLIPAAHLAALSVERRTAMWQAALAAGHPVVRVGRDARGVDGAPDVVGFVAYGRSRDPDAPPGGAEVWSLYLDPSAWSQGIGRALWTAARDDLAASACRDVSLWAIDGNRRAIRFYEAAGFVAEPTSARRFELGGATLTERRYRWRAPGIALATDGEAGTPSGLPRPATEPTLPVRRSQNPSPSPDPNPNPIGASA
ncbi:MAG: GNAT family N-acetyltransferase [Burkholderiaceae bacterium]